MSVRSVSTEELAFREGDGMSVSLLWERQTNRIRVNVFDRKDGHSFTINVAEDENPMEVFRHPYAFAARPSRVGQFSR